MQTIFGNSPGPTPSENDCGRNSEGGGVPIAYRLLQSLVRLQQEFTMLSDVHEVYKQLEQRVQ